MTAPEPEVPDTEDENPGPPEDGDVEHQDDDGHPELHNEDDDDDRAGDDSDALGEDE